MVISRNGKKYCRKVAYFLIALGVLIAYIDYLGGQNVKDAGSLFYEEVWGNNDPFWKWLGAIILIGLIGYIPNMEPISTAMLGLVLLALIASHSEAYNQLMASL